MAITWTKYIPNPDPTVTWPTHIAVPDGVTHEGCVLNTGRTREVRIMSDVWSDETFCTVVDPDTLLLVEVHISGAFEHYGRSGIATPDLSPDLRARLDAKQAALAEQARIRAEADRVAREEAAEKARIRAEERLRTAPTKGRVVQVNRGRKVPKGTVGWVFWVGGDDSERVGLALSNKRDPQSGRLTEVAWVNAAHCDALPEGNSEDEVTARLAADRKEFDDFRAAQKAGPKKGPLPVDKVPF